jgi:hypothetical protein
MLVRTHQIAGRVAHALGRPLPLPTELNTTQRFQVPSAWTGPSFLLTESPPYRQPALAGGAEAISPPAISEAASPATMFLHGSLLSIAAGNGHHCRCAPRLLRLREVC